MTARRGRRRDQSAGQQHRQGRARASAREDAVHRSLARWQVVGATAIAAKVAVAVLVFHPGALTSFSLPKSAAGLATAFLLLAVVLMFVRRFPAAAPRMSWLHGGVVAFVAANAAAAALAMDPFIAAFGAADHYLGLVALLDGLVLYAATAVFVRSQVALRRLLLLLVAICIPALAYSVAQAAGIDPIRWSTASGIASTVGNRGPLASYFVLTALAASAFLAYDWERSGPPTRIALAGVAIACVLVSLSLGARAPLIGLATGLLTLILLRLDTLRRLLPRGGRGRWALVGIGALLLVAAAPVGARLAGTLAGEDASGRARLILWSSAVELFAARPALGLGPDNFSVGYLRVRPGGEVAALYGGNEVHSVSTHSWPLRIVTDAGALGALAYVLVVLAAARAAVRSRGAPSAALGAVVLAGYLGQGLVGVDHIAIDWVPWLGLGLIASAAPDDRTVERRPAGHAGLDAAAVGAALILAILAWQPVRASEALLRSEVALGRKDVAQAIAAAGEATAIDPLRPLAWQRVGLAYEAGDRLRESVTAFERAAALQPYRADSWRALAIAYMNLRTRDPSVDPQHAIRAAERGVEAEPQSPVSYYVLSRAASAAGDDERAVREGERSIALWPSPDAIESTARAYLRLGRVADARRLVFPALARHPELGLIAAEIHAASGDQALAIAQLDEYLRLRPTDTRAIDLRRRLAGR